MHGLHLPVFLSNTKRDMFLYFVCMCDVRRAELRSRSRSRIARGAPRAAHPRRERCRGARTLAGARIGSHDSDAKQSGQLGRLVGVERQLKLVVAGRLGSGDVAPHALVERLAVFDDLEADLRRVW